MMASFHRCDRCKKEAEVKAATFPSFDPYGLRYDNEVEQQHCELCRSCQISLDKWWNDPQTDK